jgi:hypothetical protein
MKRIRLALLITINLGLVLCAADYIDYITSLPPLFAGLEVDSNLTLQRLLENRARSTDAEDMANDKANRSIKRDMIDTRGAFLGGGESKEWILTKLNRFYQASQNVRPHADVYSPIREYIIFFDSEDRYSAEWSATLRLIASGRHPFSEILEIADNDDVARACAGRLGYGTVPKAEIPAREEPTE